MSERRVIALSGGVGGAKLVLGLSHVLPGDRLTVVTNTGDDFDHLGLRICPDTDTVLYTLAGLADPEKGWGRTSETWTFMKALSELGGEDWFSLGDGDLALHVLRTHKLAEGKSLSEVTAEAADILKIAATVLPMSDQPVATHVDTPDGQLAFQHYFVRERCAPIVTGFDFKGIGAAAPNPLLVQQLEEGPEAIIIAPSNPYISVDPILLLPGLRARLRACGAPIIAISPIVGGAAIKGPAAKMMSELGIEVSALGIAKHYQGLIDGLILDEQDEDLVPRFADIGMKVRTAPTVMVDLETRKELARQALEFARDLGRGQPR